MAKTRKKKAVPEQNPYEVPMYTPWDVARYLRVPVWTLATLMGRHHPWIDPEFFFLHFWRDVRHAVLDDDMFPSPVAPEDRLRIPFRQLAALFVRAGVFQAHSEWPVSSPIQSDRWENSHRLVWRGLEDTQHDPVPFNGAPVEERVTRIAAPFVARLDERLATLIRKHLTIRLERVDTEAGLPVRIYPPSRDPADTATRIIVLDPKVRFGRPTLAGRALPTDSLFERHQAGDSIAALAADYDIPVAEVEEAIRYESRPSAPLLPFSGW
jgi:uncharacterized protein (DUF433 family)